MTRAVGVWVIGLAGWLSVASVAETPARPVGGPGIRPVGPSQVPTVKVFGDDDKETFKLSSDQPQTAPVSKSSRSGTERSVNTDFPELNEQNIRDFAAKCASQKDDHEAYTKCYKQERDRTLNQLEQKQQTREEEQAKPLKTVPKLRIAPDED